MFSGFFIGALDLEVVKGGIDQCIDVVDDEESSFFGFLNLSEDVVNEIDLGIVVVEALFVLEVLFLLIEFGLIHAIIGKLGEPAPMQLLFSRQISNNGA